MNEIPDWLRSLRLDPKVVSQCSKIINEKEIPDWLEPLRQSTERIRRKTESIREWDTNDLREARRSESQTLNDIALRFLGTIEKDGRYLPEITDTIRKALTAKVNPQGAQ